MATNDIGTTDPATEAQRDVTPARVTRRNRITGTERRVEPEPVGPSRVGHVNWSAVWASVFSGLGITLLLVALGSSLGLESGDDGGNASAIGEAVGWWTAISAVVGTFIGCFIGGRFARYLQRASAMYHGITSWGVVTVLGVLLASFGAAGLLGSAMQALGPAAGNNQQVQNIANGQAPAAGQGGQAAAGGGQASGAGKAAGGAEAVTGGKGEAAEASRKAADTAADASWALTFGLLATLVTAILGWFLGSRKPLFDIEEEAGGKVSTTA